MMQSLDFSLIQECVQLQFVDQVSADAICVVPVKREDGESPSRSRRCNRELARRFATAVVRRISNVFNNRGKVPKLRRSESQKTCLRNADNAFAIWGVISGKAVVFLAVFRPAGAFLHLLFRDSSSFASDALSRDSIRFPPA